MDPWSKFAKSNIAVDARPDGALVLNRVQRLGPYDRCVGDVLARQATANPERLHLAERDDRGEWRGVTYGESYAAARAIGQNLLDRNVDAERPVLIVSENRVEFGLLGLGAALVGLPFAPRLKYR